MAEATLTVIGVVESAKTVPVTAGASYVVATAFLSAFTSTITNLTYDLSTVGNDLNELKENGTVSLNLISYVPESGDINDILKWFIMN